MDLRLPDYMIGSNDIQKAISPHQFSAQVPVVLLVHSEACKARSEQPVHSALLPVLACLELRPGRDAADAAPAVQASSLPPLSP